MHRIIVVGGGAGGLELATRLAQRWGAYRRQPKVVVTLVDVNTAHLWKPLLHEAAAGSIEVATHELDYITQAKYSGFNFQQGALKSLNRAERYITVESVTNEDGVPCLPERTLYYDTLVLAIGSVTNFFNIPGAEAHSFALDNVYQAESLRRHLRASCLQTQEGNIKLPIRITIVGGGATGVELAAELHHTMQSLGNYGVHKLDVSRDVQITIIEAASRILPVLSEKTANAAQRTLKKLGIAVKTNAAVNRVTPQAIYIKNDEMLASDLTVWAAGIQAASILNTLDGLQVNKQNQIVVHPTLQSVTDTNIFAFGDCASCPWIGHTQALSVPPRAQAAHQQASFLLKQLKDRLAGKTIVKQFQYRDFGALVTLGHTGVIGNLKDGLTRQGFFISGWLARWMYFSLYRLHIATLKGWGYMIIDTLARWLTRYRRPRVKLH